VHVEVVATIKRNMFYQALAQIGGKGLMFFVYMLLARILGPALYGVFGYTLSSVQIISGVLFDLGLLLIVTRELSVNNDSIFRPALWLKAGGCIVGGVLFLLLIPALKFPLILAISLVVWAMLNSFTDFYFCVFRAKNMMHGEAATMLSQRALLLGILIALYIGYLELDSEAHVLYASGAAFCCSALFGLVVAVSLTRLMLPTFPALKGARIGVDEVKALAVKALPLVGVSFFGFIYYKIDIVLLGLLSTNEQVGFYNASYRIVEASLLIPMIMTNTMYPRLSLLWINDFQGFCRIIQNAIAALFLISLLAWVGIATLSTPIMVTLFGTEFEPSAGILSLLAGTIIMVYPGYLMTQSLVILGKQRGYLVVTISAAVINVVLNCLFIPLWQAKGAAVATIITEAVVTCIAGFIIIRHMKARRRA
jgi:O-antigen/teichoic acid export membrane protein